MCGYHETGAPDPYKVIPKSDSYRDRCHDYLMPKSQSRTQVAYNKRQGGYHIMHTNTGRRNYRKRQTTLMEFMQKLSKSKGRHKTVNTTTSSHPHGEYYDTNVIHIQGIKPELIPALLQKSSLHVYRFISGVDSEQLSKKCESFFPHADHVITPCTLDGTNIEELDNDAVALFEKVAEQPKLLRHMLRYIIANLLAVKGDFTTSTKGKRIFLEHPLSTPHKAGSKEANVVLRVNFITPSLLNETNTTIRLTAAYKINIYANGHRYGMQVLSRILSKEEQVLLLQEAQDIIEQTISYIIDVLNDSGLEAAQVKLVVTGESTLNKATPSTISTSANNSILPAVKYDIPHVTLIFGNYLKHKNPFGIFHYGPLYVPREDITVFVAAPESILPSALVRLRQTIGRHVRYLRKKLNINFDIEFEELYLSSNDPNDVVKELRSHNIAEQDKGEATIIILDKRDKKLYESAKALSFKKDFYFKAQVMIFEKLNKMSLENDGRFITATILASLVFRAEGTPWLAVTEDSLFKHHDVLASRLVAGIGFSKPLRKGFTRASVALMDLYSILMRVKTLDLNVRRRKGLLITEEDAVKIANILQKYVDQGDYKEVAIYTSKLLSSEEATTLYNKLTSKLHTEKIVIASVVKAPPLLVLKRYRQLQNKALHITSPTYGETLLLWTGQRSLYPLTLVIYYPSDLTPSDIKHEMKITNILRYMYYPSSVPTPERRLAPIEYAAKVARVAHLLNR